MYCHLMICSCNLCDSEMRKVFQIETFNQKNMFIWFFFWKLFKINQWTLDNSCTVLTFKTTDDNIRAENRKKVFYLSCSRQPSAPIAKVRINRFLVDRKKKEKSHLVKNILNSLLCESRTLNIGDSSKLFGKLFALLSIQRLLWSLLWNVNLCSL